MDGGTVFSRWVQIGGSWHKVTKLFAIFSAFLIERSLGDGRIFPAEAGIWH